MWFRRDLHTEDKVTLNAALANCSQVSGRWGERYFALELNDFDLSANNGGWQWLSSSGCDAQPYSQIFNPVHQSERFDAQEKFIKRYLPQLVQMDPPSIHAPWSAHPKVLSAAGIVWGQNYPKPIVDHAQARAPTLQRYGVVRKVPQTSTAVAQ